MDRKTEKSINGNLLVLTHWSYNDALVQTYTLPYLRIMRQKLPSQYKIILVTMEQAAIALSESDKAAINQQWQSQNIQLQAFPYKNFGLKKMIASVGEVATLCRLIRREEIKAIHAFCMPAGAMGYILCKLMRIPLIIDSYEPHAENMLESNTWTEKSMAFRILHRLEKLQSQYASSFIATSSGMRQYAQNRFGVTPSPFYVKPACVDLDKFHPHIGDGRLRQELNLENKIVCVYAGKLGGIYLREEIFDFVRQCYLHWGERFRFLMLTNATAEEVATEIVRTGIPSSVIIQRFVQHSEVPKYMSIATFALNPVKPVPTKRYCTSIKDGEYWASGLPVVITKDISDDSGIITENNIGYELQELTEAEYKKAIDKREQLLQQDQAALKQRIRKIAEKYRSFKIAEDIYTKIYSKAL